MAKYPNIAHRRPSLPNLAPDTPECGCAKYYLFINKLLRHCSKHKSIWRRDTCPETKSGIRMDLEPSARHIVL